MTYRPLIAVTAAITLALGSSAVCARDSNSAPKAKMSIPDIVHMLQDKGYTDVDSIDRDLDRYELHATNADGKRQYLIVDGNSGKILIRQPEGTSD